MGFGMVILKHVDVTEKLIQAVSGCKAEVLIRDGLIRDDLAELMELDKVLGVSTNYFEEKDIYKAKRSLKENGIDVAVFESAVDFADFKLMDNGLIPAVVQD